MAANKTFTELEKLTTVDKNNDWMAVVDVSDTTASVYGTTKKANVSQFIGDKGEAATVDVGTTTTLSAGSDATVSNSGSTSAAVLDFGIPGGPQGVQGIQGVAGADGADGANAYVYIAYASDASGTGFTLTFNASLDYIAIKATTTEIASPVASDFTGLWKNYKGAQGIQGIQGIQGVAGADGTDGTDGVNAYVYIAYASDASGTDFTMTFNALLDYVAIKATTTEIVSPTASDFTGLWKNYKGAQGEQGDPGVTYTWKGPWATSTSYLLYDTIESGGSGYVCVEAHTSGIFDTDLTAGKWQVFTSKGADGLGITWRGVYSEETQYAINDAVSYLGSSYICKLSSVGNAPTNTTYWDKIAEKGADGLGAGDVSGPASATDNAIARFDLTTGKLIQNSTVTIDDSGSINIPAGQQYLVNGSPVSGYSDEQAQDAVGTILTDTTTVDFTYTDGTPSITADVKDASVANAKLANMATKTYKGRTSATTGVPEDVAVATLKTDLALVKADVGLDNVDNTSDATKNSATVTLTNKTIDGDTNTISNLAHGAEVDNPTSGVHGVTGSVVGTTDTQTLSAKTLTSPVLDTGVSGTAVLDEDDMASNSATQLATQQSIKAYVDAKGFVWKGPWTTPTGYLVNDTVESNGSGYVCTSAHTSGGTTEPGVGASWTTNWDLFVEGTNKTMPTGDVVGTTDTQTLTNKTIDGDDNTLSDISPSSIKGGLDGWIPISSFGDYTFVLGTADDPSFSIEWDDGMFLLSYIGVGMKIKWTQNGTVRYGFITYADANGGLTGTEMVVYGGTDYNVDNTTTYPVSNICISREKAPFGFPMSPAKWTVSVTDTSSRAQTTPTSGTWYNIGSITISIPIGAWKVMYKVTPIMGATSPSDLALHVTLSTANNTNSNTEFHHMMYIGNCQYLSYTAVKESQLIVTSKTNYYLNTKGANAGINLLRNDNNQCALHIKATCTYL